MLVPGAQGKCFHKKILAAKTYAFRIVAWMKSIDHRTNTIVIIDSDRVTESDAKHHRQWKFVGEQISGETAVVSVTGGIKIIPYPQIAARIFRSRTEV